MENSHPIQVVLNTSEFIHEVENSAGGRDTDFFAYHDTEFAKHRQTLCQQLIDIRDSQMNNKYSDVSFAKITLSQSALAKSHRPSRKLFDPKIAPIVGAGKLGELYVELQPSSIDKVMDKMGQAEVYTRTKIENGMSVVSPSRIRSEIGAVDSISPYSADDKRDFSVNEAINWLSDDRTGGFYIVELFVNLPVENKWHDLSTSKKNLFTSFFDGLKSLEIGLYCRKISRGDSSSVLFEIKLEDGNSCLISLSPRPEGSKTGQYRAVDLNPESHAKFLGFLDAHPLVKKVILPPVIVGSDISSSERLGSEATIPDVNQEVRYPVLAIADGGVSDVMGDWIVDRYGFINSLDKDESHGTSIAGLVVMGNSLNGNDVCSEKDGCRIVDIDLYPKSNFGSYYKGPFGLIEELEMAIEDLKDSTGFRVVNFSMNYNTPVKYSSYSIPAQMLDKIAEDQDVIFVISVGNLHNLDRRQEWPADAVDVLKTFVSVSNDELRVPAESSRNVSVSALNPPDLKGIVPFGFANYSCRGYPSTSGLKPDLAHFGGSGSVDMAKGTGLYSIDAGGFIVDVAGTSFAAPNVAKTLACIDNAIEGDVSRETLIALLIHHSFVPKLYMDHRFNTLAKHLIGFGIPQNSEKMLVGDDNEITLVFSNRITSGRKMSFNFTWPSCLMRNGKCIGKARLTIVSTPPLDYKFGAEYVRVNVSAHLRQMQNDGKYKGRLKAIYTPKPDSVGVNVVNEKEQIEYSFKWSPVKVYEGTFKSGVGPSATWKLDIEYLARSGEVMPEDGVPFTAILTISDPKGEAPVFNEMKQTLQALGVQIADIRTAARILPRV